MAAALPVVACGGSATNTGNSAPPSQNSAKGGVDPCRLLTKDEVAAALGTAVNDGKPNNDLSNLGFSGCSWFATDPSNISDVVVTFDPSSTAFDDGKKQTSVPVQPVSGLGDDAYFFGSGPDPLLEVKTSKGVLNITVIISNFGNSAMPSPAADAQNAAEIQLAHEALARL